MKSRKGILNELLQLNESEEPEFELPEFIKDLIGQEGHSNSGD
jgi:hypothetical protein